MIILSVLIKSYYYYTQILRLYQKSIYLAWETNLVLESPINKISINNLSHKIINPILLNIPNLNILSIITVIILNNNILNQVDLLDFSTRSRKISKKKLLLLLLLFVQEAVMIHFLVLLNKNRWKAPKFKFILVIRIILRISFKPLKESPKMISLLS